MLGHCSKSILLSYFAWLSLGAAIAAAQYFVVPTAWQGPLNPEWNPALNKNAASALIDQVNLPEQTNGTDGLVSLEFLTDIFVVLALQDLDSGNETWKDLVLKGMQHNYDVYGVYGPSPSLNSDAIYWGLAFYYAYRSYNDSSLLQYAQDVYNVTYMNGFISPDNPSTGRAGSIPPTCNATNTGGVYWAKDNVNDTTVNMQSIGPFMVLSAYLFEETNDTMYQEAGQLSLNFILNNLWDGTVVWDAFDPRNCSRYNDGMAPHTSNQGWFLEGLSIWSDVTRDETLHSWLDIAAHTCTTNSGWTNGDGIITEEGDRGDPNAISKGIFIRGLSEVRRRNHGPNITEYLQAFTTVQLNSILDNSYAPYTHSYATSWLGPANPNYNMAGSLAALDVLNAALTFQPPPSPSSTQGSSHMETVIVGAVSGVVGGAVVVATFLLWHRRRMHRKEAGAEILAPYPIRESLANSSKWGRMNTPYQHVPQVTNSVPRSERRISRSSNHHPEAEPHSDLERMPMLPPLTPNRDLQEAHSDVVHPEDIPPGVVRRLTSIVARVNHLLRGSEAPPPYCR